MAPGDTVAKASRSTSRMSGFDGSTAAATAPARSSCSCATSVTRNGRTALSCALAPVRRSPLRQKTCPKRSRPNLRAVSPATSTRRLPSLSMPVANSKVAFVAYTQHRNWFDHGGSTNTTCSTSPTCTASTRKSLIAPYASSVREDHGGLVVGLPPSSGALWAFHRGSMTSRGASGLANARGTPRSACESMWSTVAPPPSSTKGSAPSLWRRM
mmetsp:Transcript_21918/g.86980  ORF Transcript_21918/g.86980 Transcript_21918/m.86980 type:complete len:213 (-) Transcript_21918:535-1173(-)